MNRFVSFSLIFSFSLGFFLSGSTFAQEIAVPKEIEPFFQKHCFRCHGNETQEADLNLHSLTRKIKDSADALNWQDILDKLNAGEMPPGDETQPTREELVSAVGHITESLFQANKMLKDSGGAIVVRRM